MENPLTDVVVLLCQAALMEEGVAAAFLQERLETRQTVNDWLLLALMWLRPEEAHEKYLALTQGEYVVTFVSSKIEALWQAHRLRASDKEAQEAYHVMGALLSSDPVEASKYQSMQSYLLAIGSL